MIIGVVLIGLCILAGCEKDKESGVSAATSISRTDKIPEEGLVDDMQDYIDILGGDD